VPSIAADAGPLVALFDGSDHHHDAAVAFVADLRQPLATNLVVIAEVVALCERLEISMVATLDQHFDVYRTSERKHLRNVFFSE
jgi:predicted nucleic acid-binding protein